MNREILYSKQAYKYLSKLHKPKAKQIVSAINKLPDEEQSKTLNIKKMKGIENLYRLRVDDYRVLFSPELEVIRIDKIDTRGGIYRGFK